MPRQMGLIMLYSWGELAVIPVIFRRMLGSVECVDIVVLVMGNLACFGDGYVLAECSDVLFARCWRMLLRSRMWVYLLTETISKRA